MYNTKLISGVLANTFIVLFIVNSRDINMKVYGLMTYSNFILDTEFPPAD